MGKMVRYTLYVLTLIFFAQCGHVPAIYYYQIDYPLTGSASPGDPIPVTLGMAQLESDILYQGDRIVYRNSPYEVQYYHYRRWIAPPRIIVEEKIFEQFRSSGVFQNVVRIPAPVKIDYVLRGKIKAFEEWDENDSWYGMVTLAFELENVKTKAIIWKNEFSEKTRALKKEPVEVVKAISESLKKVVEEAIREIEENLKSEIK